MSLFWRQMAILAALIVAVPSTFAGQAIARSGPSEIVSQEKGYADITFHGVVINPTKTDGRSWDPTLKKRAVRKLANQVAALLATVQPQYVAAYKLLSRGISALGPPDVTGQVRLDAPNGSVRPTPLRRIKDSFAPNWPGVTWKHVEMSRSTRLTISLVDFDEFESDPIGDVIINIDDFATAAREQQVVPILTRDQDPRILWVRISVFPSK
jgi:hypothetical protein